MDILSLPDEMLSIVLKYMRVTELRLLRKTNERVNGLAERANIGKLVPVNHLQFTGRTSLLFFTDLDDFKLKNPRSLTWRNNSELSTFLSRIAVEQKLSFDGYVDENLLAILTDHRIHLRHITYLDICNSVHDLPIEIAKKFLHETLSRLETITLTFYGRTTLENICCCEVLGGRNWKRMILRIAEHTQIRLEAGFLLEVVPKCEKFEFYSNHFAIEEVIALLKKCKSINRISHEFHFFSLGLSNVRLSDVADSFTNEFDVASVQHETIGYTTTYRIKIPHCGRNHTLRFQIKEDKI